MTNIFLSFDQCHSLSARREISWRGIHQIKHGMGDLRVRKIRDEADRANMYHHALADIRAFERMLAEGRFTKDPTHIGAEQELCLVDRNGQPRATAMSFLEEIGDEHFTNEIARFNLEVNLDPHRLADDCFSVMEKDLTAILDKGRSLARTREEALFLTGILPTLKYRHLSFDQMTPAERYRTLSNALLELRGRKFEVYLQGTDELIQSLDSVLFEACNTSFQLHLQIDPDRFVDRHNWSQMIAGPVLSTAVNSPLLLGKELWHETRIALFKQSLDTRGSDRFLRSKMPRVYFGGDWLRNSPADLWKNDLMRFPLLLTADGFQDAAALLDAGKVPDLRAIRLHSGTTYTWNRMVYGPSKKAPNLRIECRYLPAGPSVVDELANFALWAGLMECDDYVEPDFWKRTDFKVAKSNFISSARKGFDTVFEWMGEKRTARDLLLEDLLPAARRGLEKKNILSEDIDRYLGVVETRAEKNVTGAEWMIRNFRRLKDRHGEEAANREIVRASLAYQQENLAVHEWEDIFSASTTYLLPDSRVEERMSRDILSVNVCDSLELVTSIMEWNNIHHLPVESTAGELVGLITDGMLLRRKDKPADAASYAHEIMMKSPLTVAASDSLHTARELMDKHDLSGLPVVSGNKLVGILTKNDLPRFGNTPKAMETQFR